MSSGDARPTQPLPDWAYAEPEPRPRRRAWPWIIAAVIVVGLAVAAWFAGEWIARGLVEKTIRDQIVTRLALSDDQQIDVGIEGAVVPQLIAGRFDEVSVASDDVAIGPVTADVSVEARGISLSGTAETATATVSLDEAQLRALLSSVEGFPADTVGLDEPDVTISVDLSLFGATIPVGVSLAPSASAEGDLVLTPASIQLAGADVTADELKRQFGILSNAVLRDWPVCLREYVPAGIRLTDVHVEGVRLVADLDIDGRIATDPALRETGTCA